MLELVSLEADVESSQSILSVVVSDATEAVLMFGGPTQEGRIRHYALTAAQSDIAQAPPLDGNLVEVTNFGVHIGLSSQ